MLRKSTTGRDLVLAVFPWVLATVACAGRAPTPTAVPPPEPLVPYRFLAENGLETIEGMAEPGATLEELQVKAREASAAERPRAQRDVALKHLYAAETAEGEAATKSFDAAIRLATKTARRLEDEELAADLSFIASWCSWRAGRKTAPSLVGRFLRDHAHAGELTKVAWAIKGEIGIESEQWSEAIDSFRHLIGTAADPLYAYSLYRIGVSYKRSEAARNAGRAFRQVRDFGCDVEAPDSIRYIARLAAAEVGTEVHLDGRGRPVPATCSGGQTSGE